MTNWFEVGYSEGRKGSAPIPPTGKLEKIEPGSVAAYMEGWRKGHQEHEQAANTITAELIEAGYTIGRATK